MADYQPACDRSSDRGTRDAATVARGGEGVPRASLRVKSNDGLVALSLAHPAAEFEVLGAWPDGDELRLLVRTESVEGAVLERTLADITEVHDFEVRHADAERVLVEVSTPTPAPHGAMAESGVVPSFPLRVENGWLVGDLVASRAQLSAFRDELRAADIEFEVTAVSPDAETAQLLTDRQREVVDAALAAGYYESPRACTLTGLADSLDVNKSVVSRVLHRAEGRVVAHYRSSDRDTA